MQITQFSRSVTRSGSAHFRIQRGFGHWFAAIRRHGPGAMTFPQRFGNWLAPALIRLYGYRFSDLGFFGPCVWEKLLQLDMADPNFGWTVEIPVKAAKQKLVCREVPVRYRKRAGGKSKVSGTIKGTVLASWKIIITIFRLL